MKERPYKQNPINAELKRAGRMFSNNFTGMRRLMIIIGTIELVATKAEAMATPLYPYFQIKSGVRTQVKVVHIAISLRFIFIFPTAANEFVKVVEILDHIPLIEKNIRAISAGYHF